jgi:hypothetical protein
LALRRTDTGSTPWRRGSTSARQRAVSRAVDLPTFAWRITLAIAAAYLALFVVKLPHDITALGWNPDVGSAFVLPETLVETGPGGHTVLASAGQWVLLWFGLLTARLPLHRELWGIAPTLLFVTSAFIVGWSVSQLAGRRAAVLAVLIGLVASPLALVFFMAPFSHNAVYPCTALLGAYLVWLTRGQGRRRVTTIAVPPVLGVAVGTCIASDFLLAATAVIPLTFTAGLALLRRDRRSRLVAASALATVAVAIPIAKLTSALMHSLGYLTLPTPVHVAALSELPARAELLFKGLKALFNGYLGTEKPGTLHTPLGIASDVVMSAALVTLLVLGALTTVRFISSGLRKSRPQTSLQLARSLHIIYWVTSAAAACGAFWIAGEGPVTTHESYYATVIFSVAAVLPLLLSTSVIAHRLILVGTSTFFTASLVGLTNDYVNVSAPLARSAQTITRIAEANHLQVGYSNWGDSSGLTWGTHGRVIVRPLVECANPEGADLCPGFQALVPSWYVPQQRRTFLLIDANEREIVPVPGGLGKPLAVYTFESMRMYIYPYDIASRLGPAIE